MGFNVSFRPLVTNFSASVTFGVCILCGRRTGVPGERTTAGLIRIQTEPKQTWSRLPRVSETRGLLSQVETFDKQAASGMWRGTLLHWNIIFSSAACIIKRAVVRPPTKPAKGQIICQRTDNLSFQRFTDLLNKRLKLSELNVCRRKGANCDFRIQMQC